ncbi:MAG: hypothetical protein JXA21_00540 [Anaerolineae bacterium]|nr:hypothetical protein [Anaerolineae bacterium]
MNEDSQSLSGGRHPRIRAMITVLGIALIGPALGLLFFALGIVLAPPWIGLTGLLYLSFPGMALFLGIVALLMRLIKTGGLLTALALAGIVGVFYLALIGPGLPGGMTDCQPIAVSSPQVRYICVSTSSDDAGYRDEFAVEGRSGWPLMRLKRLEQP